MSDKEKVIKGLKYCTITDGIECPNCPYRHEDDCIEMLTADALAMLKEQDHIRAEKEVNNLIKKSLPVTELLAGLAEESAELSQAALKLRRVFDGTNPTPTSEDQAIEDLHEEIADVKLYISMLDVNPQYISQIMKRKLQRWEERLASRKEGRGH